MNRLLDKLPNNEDEISKTYKCGVRCFGTLAAVGKFYKSYSVRFICFESEIKDEGRIFPMLPKALCQHSDI